MNQLNINDDIIKKLAENLITGTPICILGGSKCGKSRLAIKIIEEITKNKSYKQYSDVIDAYGVKYSEQYNIENLEKPILFIKDMSTISLIELEDIKNKYHLIITTPVQELNYLHSRLMMWNEDLSNNKEEFNKRVTDIFKLIIITKKLLDGNVYISEIYKTSLNGNSVDKEIVYEFIQDTNMFSVDFSRVTGKYVYHNTF